MSNQNTLEQWLHQGLQAHQQGQWERAATCYSEALKLDAEHAETHHLMGALSLQLGHFAEAVQALEKATQKAPAQAQYWNNLGLAYQYSQALDSAREAFQKALQQRPRYPEARLNLAQLERQLEQHEAALKLYQQALQQGAPRVPTLYFMGTLLDEMGRLCEAAFCFQEILNLDNHHADTWESLATNALNRGDIEQSLQAYRTALLFKPDSAVLYSAYVFASAAAAISPAQQAEILQGWDSRFAQPQAQASPALPVRDRDPERRLRVGYVGAHFSGHSSAHISRALFEFSDSQNIEIFAYNNAKPENPYDPFFREHSHHWRDVHALSDPELAELLRQDGLDLAVDLNGHTRDHRLLALAQRCAPLQIAGLCFSGSTGQSNMDVLLSDPHIMPPERAQAYGEKVLYLDSLLCWYAPDFDLEPGPLPEMATGQITFGSGNRWFKHTPEVLRLWSDILKAVPESRLLLKSPELDDPLLCQWVHERFAAWDIASERVIFQGRTDQYAHFKNYQQIDIALDPFPYDGGMTSIDTLWMGVPVISMATGQRAGVSILNQVGLTAYLAQSESEYIHKAVSLAQDREQRQHLRHSLRERLLQSKICDLPAYTQKVEDIYRELWREWVRAEAPGGLTQEL